MNFAGATIYLAQPQLQYSRSSNRISISAEVKQEKEEKKGDKTICRECYQGVIYRSFSLENKVDESKAQTKFDNGVLELTLPNKNGNGAKQLQIK